VKKPSIMVGGFNDIYREVNMRELNLNETEVVSGGFFGITEIEAGLAAISQFNAVVKAGTTVFAVSYAAGTLLYHGYEYFTGDSLGGWAYEFLYC
jgi:hypothetical protein